MAIWTAELKELEKLYESIKGQLPNLKKELERLIKADDENMILLYSRRCLEVIVSDLCECELKRPRKTEPLKGIIDKLHKEEKVPSHIITSMHGLNDLSTYGAHPKDFDPKQVRTALINLETIIEWYLKHKVGGAEVVARLTEEIRQEVKSTENVKKKIQIPRKRLISFIAGSILLIVFMIAVLFFTNIIGGNKKIKELEKSIAVLPFRNDSPSDTNNYFINGLMEKILNNLQMVKELRVISRTSVEQYRNTTKSIQEIAKEQDVNFIVEGSGQKYGNTFSISVQLINAVKENHLWGKSYEKQVKEIRDITNVQSEIAQSIATELRVIITAQEKQLIDKLPTLSLTANDFYLRGNDEISKFYITSSIPKETTLFKAEGMFKNALEQDSGFAQAYVGLAKVFWYKYYWESYFSTNFLDSVLILSTKALSIDDKLAEAYNLRGSYYAVKGLFEKAFEDVDKAIEINPNDWVAYKNKGSLIDSYLGDYVQSIDNLHKAVKRERGESLPGLLKTLARKYVDIGFTDIAKNLYNQAFMLDKDSLSYIASLTWIEFSLENFVEGLNLAKKALEIDSTRYITHELYVCLPDTYKDEAYKNVLKIIENRKKSGALPLQASLRFAYAFWQVGKRKEAESYFEQQIKIGEESIKLGRLIARSYNAQYDLAATYAFLGNYAKAYQYLDEFSKRKNYPLWWVSLAKHDPLFDSIRNEERFQQILRKMEAKYQAEHERVKKWLEEQGML